jgi:hypothetical protein
VRGHHIYIIDTASSSFLLLLCCQQLSRWLPQWKTMRSRRSIPTFTCILPSRHAPLVRSMLKVFSLVEVILNTCMQPIMVSSAWMECQTPKFTITASQRRIHSYIIDGMLPKERCFYQNDPVFLARKRPTAQHLANTQAPRQQATCTQAANHFHFTSWLQTHTQTGRPPQAL